MTEAKGKVKSAQDAPRETLPPASKPSAKQSTSRKRKSEDIFNGAVEEGHGKGPARSSKRVKNAKNPAHSDANLETPNVDKSKIEGLLSAYGALPLQDSDHVDPITAAPETILALVYLAMLTSARISHIIAYESVKCLLEAGYHQIATLKKSSWEERTEILTTGGYTRYREKTATALGDLAELVGEKYGKLPFT